ncbi:MAG: SWIM zinc finger family protein [Candidatus Micrarchaeota archaeon]
MRGEFIGWWRRSWNHWDFPKAAPIPKPVPGKKGKKFGITWWGQKWIKLVESKGDEKRMARGRAYARAERVFDIRLEKGNLSAKVEGSLGDYSVDISFKTHTKKRWERIIKNINNSPEVLGVLLNNEMPLNIEEICGVSLIPESFESKCSCPDWVNPCKHIAALYYVLADEIDKAPQILFKLQGIEPEALFELLSSKRILLKTTKVHKSKRKNKSKRKISKKIKK